MSPNDPFARLPEAPRFTVTSTTVSDGDAWPAEQMSCLFGVVAGKDIFVGRDRRELLRAPVLQEERGRADQPSRV